MLQEKVLVKLLVGSDTREINIGSLEEARSSFTKKSMLAKALTKYGVSDTEIVTTAAPKSTGPDDVIATMVEQKSTEPDADMSSMVEPKSNESDAVLRQSLSERFKSRISCAIFDRSISLYESLRSERGDVPGWVLVVLMTTGLVTGIWTLAAPRIDSILRDSLDSMNGIR